MIKNEKSFIFLQQLYLMLEVSLIRSVGELFSNCFGDDFVASILHFACSCYCFSCLSALNVHFCVLFPTSNISWHFKFNWFLQKLVHLFFNRVLITILN